MRLLVFLLGFGLALPACALSKEAQEFMKISAELEPVQCEKRRLRRAIALAEAERRDGDAKAARARFARLDQDPKTAGLEKRLAELEPFVKRSPDPEDLRAIDRQRIEAFYRCQ